MNESKISVRYSKALFVSAVENNIIDKVMNDLKYIADIFRNEDLTNLMGSPVVKTKIKKDAVIEIFKNTVEELTLNFLILIIQNKREEYLPRIMNNFQLLYKAHKGLKSAEIIVSDKIEKEMKIKFHKFLCEAFDSDIEITEKIKPEIIGGFILKVGDLQIDASISTSLRKLKESLLLNTEVN